MLSWAGWILIGLGLAGIGLRTLEFVRITIPSNYGSNPGFGAYEVTTLPWWLLGSVGVGVLTTWRLGMIGFAIGFLVLGFAAQILGRVFGRSS